MVSVLIVVLLALFVSANAAGTTSILESFSKAWNDHDVEKLLTFMADDAVFHMAAGPDLYGRTVQGIDELRKTFKATFETFPDAQWVDAMHFLSADKNRGITESTFKATKTNPDGTKSRIEARMVDVITFDRGGKIIVKNAYRKDRPPVSVPKDL
ncbi:nuclear transport factor 2 family protein [archaeon]|nr:MAG: nuclear transport factor 2 family protein [archaeon]